MRILSDLPRRSAIILHYVIRELCLRMDRFKQYIFFNRDFGKVIFIINIRFLPLQYKWQQIKEWRSCVFWLSFQAGKYPASNSGRTFVSVMWSCTTLFFPCSYNSGNIIARSEQRACTPGSIYVGNYNINIFPPFLFLKTGIIYGKGEAIFPLAINYGHPFITYLQVKYSRRCLSFGGFFWSYALDVFVFY